MRTRQVRAEKSRSRRRRDRDRTEPPPQPIVVHRKAYGRDLLQRLRAERDAVDEVLLNLHS